MPALELSVLLLLLLVVPFQPAQGNLCDSEEEHPGVCAYGYIHVSCVALFELKKPSVCIHTTWDPFDVQWKEVQHCRNISKTICNVTCVFQEPSNRYWVKVEAQTRSRAGFISSAPETIDYILHVELAPPVLRVKYTRNILGVNVSFTYPDCMKDIFQNLSYDLEIWRVGSEEKIKYEDVDKPSVGINTTEWPHGKYCLHAQTSSFRVGKRSNFSEPLCLWLRGEASKWGFVALPLLTLLLTGVVMLLFCYKKKIKRVETPSALDFSRYQHPKTVMEFDERELTMETAQFTLEQKNTPALQTYSMLTPSVHSSSNEDEDSNDDSSGPIPYIKMLRFQKKDQNCPTVDMIPKGPDSSSGSGCSQLSGESWPAVTKSEPCFTAKWMTRDASSGILERTFLSEDSIMDESVSFTGDFPAAGRECWEVTNTDIDFLNPLILSESHGLNFPTDLEIRTGGVQCSGISAGLENSQTSLCSKPKGQVMEERRCQNDSSNCGDLWVKKSHLSVSCKDRIENGELVENNTLRATCHNYQPKQVHYISRT